MKAWFRPRLFISYAREDQRLAQALYASLVSHGFAPFLDTSDTLTGELFEDVIALRLRHADGVIALMSAHAAASAWCQAELTQAHALRVPVMPVQIGKELPALPEPLGWLRRLHYIGIDGNESRDALFAKLATEVRVARRRRRQRVFGRTLLIAASIGFIVAVGIWTARQLNAFERNQARTNVVDTVARAPRTLPPERIASLAVPFHDDAVLLERVRGMRLSPDYPDVARVNALMLENALVTSRNPRNRWYIKDLDWAGGVLRAAQLSAITFQQGTIRQVRFEDTYFGGVIWSDAEALRLSGLKFVRSRFDGGGFLGTSGIDLEFVNSHFSGTRLDLSNLSYTRFRSHVQDPRPGLITDEVGSFSNAVIQRCVSPPVPGVVHIEPAESGVQFDGIVFEDVRFRGTIPAGWFRRCSFLNCVFPRKLTQALLEAGENTVAGSSWVESDCD